MKKENRYQKLLEHIFFDNYVKGSSVVRFSRSEIETAGRKLEIILPKNLGDIVYTFRYRAKLPKSIARKAPKGTEWAIRPDGAAKYKFVAVDFTALSPSPHLSVTKIPDSTPGIIEAYAQSDEQALLARIRYNRLVDIFTGLTCYSLQNHLRTHLKNLGQVETDEIYVGIDKQGLQWVLPVQAKGMKEMIGIVQIEQDIALCQSKFPSLICRPIAAQILESGRIALLEIEFTAGSISVASEKQYLLVPPAEISEEELSSYRKKLNR